MLTGGENASQCIGWAPRIPHDPVWENTYANSAVSSRGFQSIFNFSKEIDLPPIQ